MTEQSEQWESVVRAGRCPLCAFGLSHTGSRCPDARRGHTYDLGYRDATTGLRISDQDAGVLPLVGVSP